MLPNPNPTTLVILVHYGEPGQTAPTQALATTFAQRIGLPVATAFLEQGTPSLGEGIQMGVIEHQPQQIIVLPVGRSASTAQQNTLQRIVDAAQDRWTNITLQVGDALDTHPQIIAAYCQMIEATLTTLEEDATAATALLVVGRGSRDPARNAELYWLARLLAEKCQLLNMEVAFHGVTQPDLAVALRRCQQAGANHVLVLPYVLYEYDLYTRIQQALVPLAHPDLTLVCIEPLALHSGVLAALDLRYQADIFNAALSRGNFS
jgi:sirohydrochlorin cobaltochelatase